MLFPYSHPPSYATILDTLTTNLGTCSYIKGNAMRKTRSDCTVGTFEKKHGLPPGTIRNKDGRDTRSDKKIGTIRKEAQNGK